MKNQSKICSVCKEKNDLHDLFNCQRCAKEFHIECNFYSEDDVRQYKIVYCDYCRYLESLNDSDKDSLNKKPIVCKICLKSDGILKKFRETKVHNPINWIHPNCIKWFLSIKLIIENGFSIAVIDKFSDIPKDTWMATCESCHKTVKDGRIKCTKKNCNKFYHISCLQSLYRKNTEKNFEMISVDRFDYLLYTCSTCSESIKSNLNDSSNTKTFGKLVNLSSDTLSKPSNAIKIDILEKKSQDQNNPTENVIIIKNHQLQLPEKKEYNNNNYFKIRLPVYTNNSSSSNELSHEKILLNSNENKLIKSKFTHISKNSINKNFKDRNDVFINIFKDQKKEYLENKINKTFRKKKKINYSFISTNLKCDICALEIDVNSEEEYIKCENCQKMSNHFECLKRFNFKQENYLCVKCVEINKESKKNYIISCFICGKLHGTMIKCGHLFVHILCYQFFPRNFNKRIDSSSISFDGKLKSSLCNLCKYTSGFTYKCQNCNVNFHPYCGFLHDFNIFSQKIFSNSAMKFEYFILDCENHYYYLSKDDRSSYQHKIQANTSNRVKDLSNGESSKKRLNKIKKGNLKKYDYQENIYSFNFSKFKKLFLKKKYIEYVFKINEFDWDYTEPYLRYLKNEELDCFNPKLKSEEEDSTLNCFYNSGGEFFINKDLYSIGLIQLKTGNILVRFNIEEVFKTTNELKENKDELQEVSNVSKRGKPEFLGKKMKRVDNNEETNGIDHDITSSESFNTKFLTSKMNENDFLNKIKLQSFLFLDNNELKILNNLDKNSSLNWEKLRNLNDIDLELFLLREQLKSQTEINIRKFKMYKEALLNSSWHKNPVPVNADKILKTFRSVQRYSFLKRRIKSGFREKKEYLERSQVYGKSAIKSRDESFKNQSQNEKIKTFETDCCVCMNSDIEDINPIVFCDSCNVSIHPDCYGIKEIPSGDYYCEKCTIKNKTLSGKFEFKCENETISHKSDKKKIENFFDSVVCCLCGKRNGAFKKIELAQNDFKWCHVICVLFSKIFTIRDYEKIEIYSPYKDIKSMIDNSEICQICNSNKGEKFKCMIMTCSNKIHILCAYFEGFQIEVKDDKEINKATNLLYDFKNLHCDLLCKNHYLEKNIENVSQKKLREKYYHKEFDYYSEVKPDLINEKHTVSSLNKIHYDSNNYDNDIENINYQVELI